MRNAGNVLAAMTSDTSLLQSTAPGLADPRLLAAVAVATAVFLAALFLVGRRTLQAADARSLASPGTVSTGAVVVALLFVAWHSLVVRLIVGLVAASFVLGVVLAGVGRLLSTFTPDRDGPVLPSHYTGTLHRARQTSHRRCPQCGVANEPEARVCADCFTVMNSAGGQRE